MTDKVDYSLKEKFFSIEKEKRISKRQFGSRIFTPGILLGICGIFIISIVGNILSSIIGIEAILFMPIVSILFYYGIMLFIIPKLVIKRCHDFDSSGIIEKRIFISAMIVFMLTSGLLISAIFGGLSFLSNYLSFVITLQNLSKISLILLGLYLLFRPGTKGSNSYGEDTQNVNIGFLG